MASARDALLVVGCLLGLAAYYRGEARSFQPPPDHAIVATLLASDSGIIAALGGPATARSFRSGTDDGSRLDVVARLALPHEGVRVKLVADSAEDGWTVRQLLVFRPDTTFALYWGYPALPPGPLAPPTLADRARRAYHNREDERVLALVARALERGADEAEALVVRGWLHQRHGRSGSALRDFELALQHEPRHFDALYGYGLELGRGGRHRESIAALDRAIRVDPDRPEAYYVRAIDWGRLGDERRQIADLRSACSHGSDDACSALRRHGLLP